MRFLVHLVRPKLPWWLTGSDSGIRLYSEWIPTMFDPINVKGGPVAGRIGYSFVGGVHTRED